MARSENAIFGPAWMSGILALFLSVSMLTPTLANEADDKFEELDSLIENKLDWEKEREHWAYQKPEKHPRPSVKLTTWPKKKIDFFVLNKLEDKGLSPSTTGSFPSLIRRVTFDITGLPPDSDLLNSLPDEFDENIYQQVVEKLLNSYAFGERMSSLWLNLARYAEDQAHKVGNNTSMFYPNAHLYRQWVIDAFNKDLPYDEFIDLQLAADLITPSDLENAKALGFLGLGPKYYNRGRLEVQADEWADKVDTVTRTFLGLTVACARCHDHKYDAITIEDYYSMAGIFASTKMKNLHHKFDGTKLTDEDKKSRKFEIHVVEDGKPQNLPVFLRGQVDNKGKETPRRFLKVLSKDTPHAFSKGSGRLELAKAISSPSNPLTARVYANRIWGLFFGKAIVNTQSNFGQLGIKPTHPKLLDDLSVRFIDSGWSTKWLIREMVFSSCYIQDSKPTPEQTSADPENLLLGSMNKKRLSIEMWRDAALKIAGELDRFGGKSLELNDKSHFKRTVYSRISRLSLNNMLMQFDYPDANVHAAERSTTITPTQKLYALNDPFFWNLSQKFASNLSEKNKNNLEALIRKAFSDAFFRKPTPEELVASINFLSSKDQESMSQFCHSLLISNEMIYLD